MRPSSFNPRGLTSTCLFCEYKWMIEPYFASSAKRRVTTSSRSNKWRPSVYQRSCSPYNSNQTRSNSTSAQTAPKQTLETAPPEYSFSVKPKNPPPLRKTQIRESLRAWSSQNERLKQEQVSEDLPFEGKINRLPNSLFIGSEQTNVTLDSTDDGHGLQDLLDNGSEDDIQHHFSGQKIQPGTLIGHRSFAIVPQDVVYLGDIGVQSLLLLSDGRWAAEKLSAKRQNVSIRGGVPIPNFLTEGEVDALREHMPKQDVTRASREGAVPLSLDVTGTLPDDAVAPILSKLRAFEEAEARFLRDHRFKLEQMYICLAYDDKWRKITQEDLPFLVIGIHYDEMTIVEKRAFYNYVNEFSSSIVPISTANSLTYYIAPKSLNDDVQKVKDWARLYQEAAAQSAIGIDVSDLLRNNPLASFIDKARRNISKSRKIRAPTKINVLGPAMKKGPGNRPTKVMTGEVFTAEDKTIIRYLWDVALRVPMSRYSLAHASLIVRAAGAYPGMDLSRGTISLFLQELGCVDPWAPYENIFLPLADTRPAWSWEMDRLLDEANESIQPFLTEDGSTTTFSDSMADIRTDWSEMAAFSIDKGVVSKIEDAISVEPATELEEGYWIHVHISHPTAHLSADHPMVKYARKRGADFYDSDQNSQIQTMLPLPVVQQFSLMQSSAVLSISTLMTKDGKVHDVRVVPGLLKNRTKLDRDAVYRAMGVDEDADSAFLVVGQLRKIPWSIINTDPKYAHKMPSQHQDVTAYLPQLFLIRDLLAARRKHREQEVEVPARFRKGSTSLVAFTNLPEQYNKVREIESYHWTGDPGISIIGKRTAEFGTSFVDHRANDITAQAMRLAGESCGKWCADRNIPNLYLGMELTDQNSIEELNAADVGEEIAYPTFVRSSRPAPLIAHNIKQQTPCTSPLRRYPDLMSHFQIDSYLKAEAAGLVKPGAPVEDDSILAYSKDAIDEYLGRDAAAGDAIDEVSRTQLRHWTLQALFRAFHFKEAALPEVMEVIVKSPARRNARGMVEEIEGILVPFTVPVRVTPSTEGYEAMASIGDFLPVKLQIVSPRDRYVYAVAVGPPTREQQLFDPIRSYTHDNFKDSNDVAKPTSHH